MIEARVASELVLAPQDPQVRGRTGVGVGVAVIDSGVHPGHPHVGGLVSGIGFDRDAIPHGDVVDRLGHGTAIAAAIHEKAPDAEIHIARVFHEELSTSVDALIAAIDWAVARGVRLVNLSLGAANAENASLLQTAVDRATEAGATLVSALEDGRRRWYPGSLPGVIGVSMDTACPREAVRLSFDNGKLLASASPFPRPIPGLAAEHNLQGVSFAVANVTGMLACALQGRDGIRTASDLYGSLM